MNPTLTPQTVKDLLRTADLSDATDVAMLTDALREAGHDDLAAIVQGLPRLGGRGRSPYTDAAISFVNDNPGCSKWDLAAALTWNTQRCPSRQYYLVNTQIRLGYLVAEHKGGRYRLYTVQQYRELIRGRVAAEIGCRA